MHSGIGAECEKMNLKFLKNVNGAGGRKIGGYPYGTGC